MTRSEDTKNVFRDELENNLLTYGNITYIRKTRYQSSYSVVNPRIIVKFSLFFVL